MLSVFNLMFDKNNAKAQDLINIKITNIVPMNHFKFFERLTLSYFNLKNLN